MQSFKLWNNTPYYMEGEEDPLIHYYPAEQKTHDGAVIIFPGGGYVHRAEHEGRGYAEFLNENGMDAFVVDYRVAPYTYPAPLLDARRAVRFVRAKATEFGIDPNRIGVMGSSAGGNLIALLCTHTAPIDGEMTDEIDALDGMPNAQIHCYSYISFAEDGLRVDWCTERLFPGTVAENAEKFSPELHIPDNAPPAFLFHTVEDRTVNVIHSLRYAENLRKKNVLCEVHIFPEGDHGMGLGIRPDRGNPHAAQWPGLLWNWLCHLGF